MKPQVHGADPSVRQEAWLLLKIALPIAAGFLAEMGMNFTDTLIVGRQIGPAAMAAVGLASGVLFSLLFVCMGVISMVGAFAAQALGAGEGERIGHIVRQGFWVALFLSLPATAFCFLYLGALLGRLGQPPEVVALAGDYLRGLAWCFLPYMLFTVLRNFVTALGRVASVMAITIGALGLNFVVVYALVVGPFGLPGLGVRGAGYGTSFVCWVMFLALAWHVARAPSLRGYRCFDGLRRFDPRLCARILRFGVPSAGISAAETGLFVVVQLLVGLFGVVALAANQVAFSVQTILFMIAAALSHAATARVGYAVGRGSLGAARRAGFLALGISAVYMAVAALAIWRFAPALAAPFMDADDPLTSTVLPLAAALLAIAAVYQIFDGIQITATGALRGLNDTLTPFLLGVLGYWGIGLGTAYLLGFALNQGPRGVWWGLAVGLAAAASLLTWRFHRRSRALPVVAGQP
jgi:MATE family multidrug resistance protein